MGVGDADIVPALNRFVASVVAKGENVTYADCVAALANISNVTEKTAAGKDGIDKQLTRLLQYGYIRVSSIEPLLKALRTSAAKDKETVPLFSRLLFYLAQLALGNGAAGTPLPMPANRSSPYLPKALDAFGPEVLSAAWADLSDEKSSFMRKQGGMRILAALAHASLTSRPDDPTYPAGVLLTLQSLLDSIDQLQNSRKSLAAVVAAQAAAAGGAAAKRKNMLADFKKQMETWGLLRLAFSAARVSLTKSGLAQIADKSFAGVCSSDNVCARHSLALACIVARDGGAQAYAAQIGASLQYNVELGKRTGQLYQAGAGAAKGKAGAPPPTVVREDTSNYLNLKDTFARIYLARGCAAVIQGGAGDIHGSGSAFWDALVLLGCADQSDVVAHEAIRAMFGAPFPHAESLRRRPGPLGDVELQEITLQGRIYAGSWQMVMSVADTLPQIPPEHMPPTHDALAQQAQGSTPKAADAASGGGGGGGGDTEPVGAAVSLFGRLTARVLYALQSRSPSMIAAGARTAAVMLEARAWYASMSGASQLETEGVKKCVRVLQALLLAVFGSEGLGAVERCAAAEALVWLQLTPPDDPRQSTLPPVALLKAAAQGGMAVQSVVKGLFADPWQEGLVVPLMHALHRRQRANPGLSCWCLELASALAAASPSHMPRDLLLSLWDAAPGHVSVKCVVELLGSPLPPITQPTSGCPVEIKALAATEEQAYEGLKAAAAWWLGEHANAVSGVSAWKAAAKASVSLDFLAAGEGAGHGLHQQQHQGQQAGVMSLEVGERLALAAAAHAPLLVMAMAHLQRHIASGSWEVRVACAQALGKIAVRSPEPHRIHAYAALRAACRGPALCGHGPGAGATPLSSWLDPASLAPVVLPVLEVLDAMYAGQQVLSTHFNLHGTDVKEWPAGALASVRRRHEWLVGAVAQRIGNMPAGNVFFPLGRRTRTLLNPDEPVEPEAVEADEDEKVLQEAAAKAAAAGEEEGVGDEYGYDQDHYDYDYDHEYYEHGGPSPGGGYRGADEADPLAKWRADGATGQDYSQVANVNWKGLGEAASTYTDNNTAQDEEDVRYGKVMFTFTAEGDDEVSVQQGDRVRVHVDMGDWMHVTNSAGQQGIVPATYVQLEQPTYERSESLASRRSSTIPPRPSGQYYDSGTEGYDMYGGDTYRHYGDYDGQGHEVGLYSNEGEAKTGIGGGFDDFGAALVAAAEARAAAAQRAADQASRKQQQTHASTLQSNPSMVSNSSFDSSRQNSLAAPSTSNVLPPAPSTSTTAGYGLQPQYSTQSSVTGTSFAGTPRPAEEQPAYAGASEAYTAPETSNYGGYGQWSTSGFDEGMSSPYQQTTTPAGGNDVAQAANAYGGYGGYGGGYADDLVPKELLQPPAAQQPQAQVGGRVRMAYEFNAETAEELTVAAGDELEIVNVLEGWLMVTRASDGATGLVPENYVEFL